MSGSLVSKAFSVNRIWARAKCCPEQAVTLTKRDPSDLCCTAYGAREQTQWCCQSQAFLDDTAEQTVVGHDSLPKTAVSQDMPYQAGDRRRR
jgi:hypothetical protein